MVRRRSTVRFRNGAPIKDQVRSSLDSSYPTLWVGAVAVLGGIWEIVFSRFSRADSRPSRPARVSREVPGSMAGTEVGRAVASRGCAFNGGVARWPCGHEIIFLLERIGEVRQRKAGRTQVLNSDSQERTRYGRAACYQS